MSQQRAKRICVFGSYNVDVVANVPRFPVPGESLIAKDSATGPGGKGINQAVAASYSGARVHFIGKVGNDDYGKIAKNYLKEVNIDVHTLFFSETKSTGLALIYVAEGNAENMIAVNPGANLDVTDQEVNRCLPVIEASDILLTQLENNIDALDSLISSAYLSGVYTVVNPAPYQDVPRDLFAKINLITPNATEATLLTGIDVDDVDSASKAAKILHEFGVESVIVTLGSLGALLSENNRVMHIPRFPANAIDTTGAGDAFNGSLVAALAEGKSLYDAAMYAGAYAACAVENHGTAIAMPAKSAALEKLEAHNQMHLQYEMAQ
ncbi:ribokinase [Photobacterium sp. DNB22_13_2]